MTEQTASVHWEGQGKQGLGKISTETGALNQYPYGFASRFEDDRQGTNPEELLGLLMPRVSRWRFPLPATRSGWQPAMAPGR